MLTEVKTDNFEITVFFIIIRNSDKSNHCTLTLFFRE